MIFLQSAFLSDIVQRYESFSFCDLILLIDIDKNQPEQSSRADSSGKWDSNPRPLAWEANALPTELLPHLEILCKSINFLRDGSKTFPLGKKKHDVNS